MKCLQEITDFVFLSDTPQAADVIVVAGSVWPEPAERAAALFHAGFAPLVIVSGRYSKGLSAFPGPANKSEIYSGTYATEADFMADVLRQNGVPDKAIILERTAEFTMENAIRVRELMVDNGLLVEGVAAKAVTAKAEKAVTAREGTHRMLICCQAFHARRCRMYFEYVFKDCDVTFLMCPAKTQGIDRENWMQTEAGMQQVFGEIKRFGEQMNWIMDPTLIKMEGVKHG